MDFSIILCDRTQYFFNDINKYINNDHIIYYNGSFQDLDSKFDCLVSAGNAFGIMDGGLDGHINKYFDEIDNFIPFIQQYINKQQMPAYYYGLIHNSLIN